MVEEKKTIKMVVVDKSSKWRWEKTEMVLVENSFEWWYGKIPLSGDEKFL